MSQPPQAIQVLKDIRFWILFFFLLRMYGITMPPLEVGHNWRQTDGLMVARNFYEHDANPFYPMVDVGGEKTGIVGCEFPILNYLIYLMSAVFGYEHWYGRLIVLTFSTIGVFYFYKLIHKFFGERPAFGAAIILMVSFWFSYSRKNIPDVFALSLCIVALFYAFQYLDNGRWRDLALFLLLALFGCLSKILAATVLTVLLLPVLSARFSLIRKVFLSAASAVIVVVICIWYFVWVPYLNTTYGLEGHFFMGLTFEDGLARIVHEWKAVAKRFYDTPLKYSGFIVLVGSIFITIRKKDMLVLVAFLVPFVSFLILFVKTGTSIIGDTYYILTAIPAMAFIMGNALARIPNIKIAYMLMAIIGIENIADQVYDFRVRQPYKALENLESIMDGVSQRDDRVAINSGKDNPTVMYFAHRRGWTVHNEMLADATFRDDLRQRGCRYIVIAKQLHGDLELDYPKAYDSEYFKVYELN
jgi:hypothetical protein